MRQEVFVGTFFLSTLLMGCRSDESTGPAGDAPDEASTGGSAGAAGDGDGDGDNSKASTQSVSGSRLSLSFWTSGETRQVKAIHDDSLGVDCTWRVAEDGEMRCLPVISGLDVLFADDACTEAVGRSYQEQCSGLKKYAGLVAVGADPCTGSREGIYEVGAEITAPVTVYSRSASGECEENIGEGQVFELSLVPATEFVSVGKEVVELSEEMGVEMWVAEDGLRTPRTLYDLEREGACHAQSIGAVFGDEKYCIGRVAYTSTEGSYGYVGETCEEAVSGTTSCEAPTVIVSYDRPDECYVLSLFEVGAPVGRSDIYRNNGEACVLDESVGYAGYFSIGSPANLDDFQRINVTHEGDERIIEEMYVSGETVLLPTSNLWDTQLDEQCFPFSAGGTFYCIPSSVELLSEAHQNFADDSCTTPIVTRAIQSCVERPLSFIALMSDSGGCDNVDIESIFLAVPYESATYFRENWDGACNEVPTDPAFLYFQQGGAVSAADTFGELSLSEEPTN